MFGLSFDKILVIGVIAVFLLGPERLPHYAAQLGRLVRRLRSLADDAKDRMRDEMGPDFDDVDWKKLDPRQYDPRRIIREALLDDEPAKPTISRSGTAVAAANAPSVPVGASRDAAGEVIAVEASTTPSSASAPFDAEAT